MADELLGKLLGARGERRGSHEIVEIALPVGRRAVRTGEHPVMLDLDVQAKLIAIVEQGRYHLTVADAIGEGKHRDQPDAGPLKFRDRGLDAGDAGEQVVQTRYQNPDIAVQLGSDLRGFGIGEGVHFCSDLLVEKARTNLVSTIWYRQYGGSVSYVTLVTAGP